METSHQYIHNIDPSDDYMEWVYPSVPCSFSAPCLSESSNMLYASPYVNTDTLNDEFLQYLHHHPHPSDVSPSSPQQQPQQPSPIDEEDDDDSLDCFITTPHQLFPIFEQYKEATVFPPLYQHQHNYSTPITPSSSTRSSISSTSSSTSSSSLSSLSSVSSSSSSTSLKASPIFRSSPSTPAWSSNLFEDYACSFVIPKSYVSLSDVNAFVAKADSIKHSASIHQGVSTFHSDEDDYPIPPWEQANRGQSSLSFPALSSSSSSSPTSSSTLSHYQHDSSSRMKVPKNHSAPIMNNPLTESPSSCYSSSSSSSSSYVMFAAEERDEAMPYAFGNNHRSVFVDEIKYDEDEDSDQDDSEDGLGDTDGEEDSDDDYEYTRAITIPSSRSSSYLSNPSTRQHQNSMNGNKRSNSYHHLHNHHHPKLLKQKSFAVKKGRNVDKACNHCKRSHLRCDNMRPCQRCISTGKTGCKDVEHKPRGRPKLNKK